MKTIFIGLFILMAIGFSLSYIQFYMDKQLVYVTSRYSKVCYHRGHENGNIREENKYMFRTAEECGKPLIK